jgi:hypothetical protein
VASITELGGRSPEPVEESAKNDEGTDEANCFLPLASLCKATAFAALLLLRNAPGKFRVEPFVGFQEFIVLGIDG